MQDKVIHLPPADAYRYPYRGYKASSNDFYKELKANTGNWQRLRARLLKEQDFKCIHCLVDLHNRRMNIEHLVPLKRGGTNHSSNLAASCSDCNRKKGNKPMKKKELLAIDERKRSLKESSRKSKSQLRILEEKIAEQIRQHI